jgi:pimeloyl-ACP methyl ester carboxylesterase
MSTTGFCGFEANRYGSPLDGRDIQPKVELGDASIDPRSTEMTNRKHPFAVAILILGAVGTLITVLLFGASASASAPSKARSTADAGQKPTIVLVHGAWADASSWAGVTARLQADGYTVVAPSNPLRDLSGDSTYLSSVLSSISGPIVLVGHSYGGMVMTNAATGHSNVKALVYIAAFAPSEGETVAGISALNPGSQLTPANLEFRPYPGGTDVYIAPSAFRDVFAADVSASTAAVMAATQEPISAEVLTEPSGIPAWTTIPSWYMVATHDQAIPPATERFMAQRAHAVTVEVSSSHAVLVSHPQDVTNLILQAAHTVR